MPQQPKILIVQARFYENLSDGLLKGAVKALEEAGAVYEIIDVPGALEIPAAIAISAKKKIYDGYVALGCVIRGETYHFEVVCNESARGLTWLSIDPGLCIGNGILTCETYDHAVVRADPTGQDKGGHAAKAALALLAIRNG